MSISKLTPTQGIIVAVDIVAYSKNSRSGFALLNARQNLFEAVISKKLFQDLIESGDVIVHFLGDELRLAFSRKSASRPEVIRFLVGIFAHLDSISDAPQIRAAIVEGVFVWDEFDESKYGSRSQYLFGPAIEEDLKLLISLKGIENQIVSNKRFQTSELIDSALGKYWMTKRLLSDGVGSEILDIEQEEIEGDFHVVFAISSTAKIKSTNPMQTPTRTLISLVEKSLEELGTKGGKVKLSVGPSAVLVALPSVDFEYPSRFLHNLEYRIEKVPAFQNLQPVIGVAAGELRITPVYKWLGTFFEGAVAIEASRIAAGLSGDGFSLTFSARMKPMLNGDFTCEEGKISGKHPKEEFKVCHCTSWLEETKIRYGGKMFANDTTLSIATNTAGTLSIMPTNQTVEEILQNVSNRLEALTGEMRQSTNILNSPLARNFMSTYLQQLWLPRTSELKQAVSDMAVHLPTAIRMNRARAAISYAEHSIRAVSVINYDDWIYEKNYLLANIERKKQRGELLSIRRLIIGDFSAVSSEKHEQINDVIKQQEKADIIVGRMTPETYERIARQGPTSWCELKNVLIVDDTYMSKSDPSSKTNEGVITMNPVDIGNEIDCFEHLWDNL